MILAVLWLKAGRNCWQETTVSRSTFILQAGVCAMDDGRCVIRCGSLAVGRMVVDSGSTSSTPASRGNLIAAATSPQVVRKLYVRRTLEHSHNGPAGVTKPRFLYLNALTAVPASDCSQATLHGDSTRLPRSLHVALLCTRRKCCIAQYGIEQTLRSVLI